LIFRVATDEEYRRNLGLILPQKLLDSFTEYLLNDFNQTRQYMYLEEDYEDEFYNFEPGTQKQLGLNKAYFRSQS
jgi:hypothetical protein